MAFPNCHFRGSAIYKTISGEDNQSVPVRTNECLPIPNRTHLPRNEKFFLDLVRYFDVQGLQSYLPMITSHISQNQYSFRAILLTSLLLGVPCTVRVVHESVFQ